MLQVSDLAVYYGQIPALHGIDFEVREGEIVALLGANGAGKTTTLRAISGLIPPSRGRVVFRGEEVTGRRANRVVRLGLAHVPQGRGIFADQSVEANLLLGAYTQRDPSRIRQLMEREFARFPILRERRNQLAGTLSGGEQQMLAISRALMAEPVFLALDEPSLGLAPLLVRELVRAIQSLNQSGLTVLVVEQMATLALSIAHRAYVLQRGRIVLAGTGSELLHHPELTNSYLG